eukprot:gene13091-biopygen4377
MQMASEVGGRCRRSWKSLGCCGLSWKMQPVLKTQKKAAKDAEDAEDAEDGGRRGRLGRPRKTAEDRGRPRKTAADAEDRGRPRKTADDAEDAEDGEDAEVAEDEGNAEGRRRAAKAGEELGKRGRPPRHGRRGGCGRFRAAAPYRGRQWTVYANAEDAEGADVGESTGRSGTDAEYVRW